MHCKKAISPLLLLTLAAAATLVSACVSTPERSIYEARIRRTDDGPRSRGLLTYSMSSNPASPHFADQTRMFSDKAWLEIPFRDEDVEAAAEHVEVVRGGRRCVRRGSTSRVGRRSAGGAVCTGASGRSTVR